MDKETIDPKLEAAADKILQEIRENKYQEALHIARNDLLTREEQIRDLSSWFENLGYSDPDLYEALIKETDKHTRNVRRSRRGVTSEGSYLFEKDLLDYLNSKKADTSKLVKSITGTEAKERQKSQPLPRSHAHHPASLSGTESLVQNMREDEIRKLWDIAKKEGYVVGSLAEGFIPLSEPGHLTGGPTRGTAYAHVGVTGEPDPGRFKTTPLPRGTTAEEAWKSLKPMLDEQIELNTIAYENPVEQLARQRAAEAMGTELQFGGSDFDTLQKQRKLAEQKGINLTTISKSLDKYPGLAETGLVPGVDVMTDVGASVPRALGGKQGGYEARRGVKQNGGKVKFSGAARRATKLLPIVPAVLGVGEAFSQAKAGDLKAAQATLAETAVGEVPVVGDILVSDPLASGTLEGAQQQAIRAQQPKSAVAKIIDNPLNELKYIGKQGLRGIKKIGGAILFGF